MKVEEGQLNGLVLDLKSQLINCEHLLEIRDIFKTVIGRRFIKSMSVYIVTPEPDNVLFLFSSHFSMEHRLIQSGHWQTDPILQPKNFKNNDSLDWRTLYAHEGRHDIFYDKMHYAKDSFAISMVRKASDFHLIYSYFLDCDELKFEDIMSASLDPYLLLGDYAYKELEHIWVPYHTGPTLPDIQYHGLYHRGPPKDVMSKVRHNFRPTFVSARKPWLEIP